MSLSSVVVVVGTQGTCLGVGGVDLFWQGVGCAVCCDSDGCVV